MKEAMRRASTQLMLGNESSRKGWMHTKHCSICRQRIWFEPLKVLEPEDAPEPRHSWVLCKQCYNALVTELRRAKIHTPLRVRVAIGMVAAERWPLAYPNSLHAHGADRRFIALLAFGFFIFMIVHLVFLVLVAGIMK